MAKPEELNASLINKGLPPWINSSRCGHLLITTANLFLATNTKKVTRMVAVIIIYIIMHYYLKNMWKMRSGLILPDGSHLPADMVWVL